MKVNELQNHIIKFVKDNGLSITPDKADAGSIEEMFADNGWYVEKNTSLEDKKLIGFGVWLLNFNISDSDGEIGVGGMLLYTKVGEEDVIAHSKVETGDDLDVLLEDGDITQKQYNKIKKELKMISGLITSLIGNKPIPLNPESLPKVLYPKKSFYQCELNNYDSDGEYLHDENDDMWYIKEWDGKEYRDCYIYDFSGQRAFTAIIWLN